MTSTRVIELPHRLPAGPAERPDDPDDAAGPRVVQGRMGRRGQPDAGSPGEAALVALAKLLARQAADADFRSQG